VLGHGGRFASLVAGAAEALARPDATTVAVYGDPKPAILQQLAGQAATAALRVPVTRRYPLKDAPRAFADFTAGSVGKLAVTVD
jgi:NADPH:quinone reductase-like Zn-dependent oxidoreductase